jgi:hypothetical protein
MLQVLGLFHIFMSYSQFCYVVLCISHVKVVVNICGSQVKWLKKHKKIVLTVKQNLKLNDKFENGESVTKLVKRLWNRNTNRM